MFSRANEHALFYFQNFEGLEAVIPFPDLGFEMGLNEVYEGLVIEKEIGKQMAYNST
jgi:hypothetical protein